MILTAFLVAYFHTTTTQAMLTITVPATPQTVQSSTTLTPCNKTHTKLRPTHQQGFDRIQFLNFKNKQKLSTLCSTQRALEKHKPYKTINDLCKKEQECINESLFAHQKKLIFQLCSLQQTYLKKLPPSCKSFRRAFKFLAIIKILQARANKNFISPRYNVNAQYQSLIQSTEHTIETSIKRIMPVTLPQAFQKADPLSLSCILLDQLLYPHKLTTALTNSHRIFALHTVETLMNHEEKRSKLQPLPKN